MQSVANARLYPPQAVETLLQGVPAALKDLANSVKALKLEQNLDHFHSRLELMRYTIVDLRLRIAQDRHYYPPHYFFRCLCILMSCASRGKGNITSISTLALCRETRREYLKTLYNRKLTTIINEVNRIIVEKNHTLSLSNTSQISLIKTFYTDRFVKIIKRIQVEILENKKNCIPLNGWYYLEKKELPPLGKAQIPPFMLHRINFPFNLKAVHLYPNIESATGELQKTQFRDLIDEWVNSFQWRMDFDTFWRDVAVKKYARHLGEMLKQKTVDYLSNETRKSLEASIIDGKIRFENMTLAEYSFVTKQEGLSCRFEEFFKMVPLLRHFNIPLLYLPNADEIYIFVLDSEERLFLAKKKRGEINHSSLLSGEPVKACGEVIFNEQGEITTITNWSGHYQQWEGPDKGRADMMVTLLEYLIKKKFDITKILKIVLNCSAENKKGNPVNLQGQRHGIHEWIKVRKHVSSLLRLYKNCFLLNRLEEAKEIIIKLKSISENFDYDTVMASNIDEIIKSMNNTPKIIIKR